jgi:ABC-type multidrug transport system ATPase subunit
LRIIGIEKTYYFLPFGLKSKKDVNAVKEVYLEVPDNELICLLGHNGAGKSTLFNMLTGILSSTGGEAKIFGYDISSEQEDIRMIMGVVPQFDILWKDLTASEHMLIFSLIKGVPKNEIATQSD